MAKTILLGDLNKVKILYSYPNNCNEVCFLDQTVEETITKYLTDSIKRDLAKSNVEVIIDKGIVSVKFSGNDEEIYTTLLPDYLKIGYKAFEASLLLNKDKKWGYNWRYFLPHGLPMANHYTVQLLHFPPDYVLTRDQNYLTAHTTLRWAELLVANGAKADETDLFQNIVDIAPVTAPSNAGKFLEGIYDYYDEYIKELLELWLIKSNKEIRPMLAFGSPVRQWLKDKYGVNLKVLSFEKIKIKNGLEVNTLASNHPSFIYNALDRFNDDPNTPEDERVPALMKIMKEDLIAARWQVSMGKNPNQDPIKILDEAKAYWSKAENQKIICQLTYQQVLNKSKEEAIALCSVAIPKIEILTKNTVFDFESKIENIVDRLREEIGALDSTEINLLDSYK